MSKIKYLLTKGGLNKFIKERQTPVRSKIIPDCMMAMDVDSVDLYLVDYDRSKTFTEMLFDFIDDKNISDVECYKRANIDRKLFSKIRSNKEYTPKKNTILALAIALELSWEQTGQLLTSAGYALSRSKLSDIIVEYFITKRKYDINLVNIALADHGEQTLN